MVIIKPRLQFVPGCGVYETPVFDSAAGGFVYVDGRTHLKKHRSAILSLFKLSRDNGWIGVERSRSSIPIAGR
jgi:hypothetical protein